MIKNLATKEWGFGGGYENFISATTFASTGYEEIINSGWTFGTYSSSVPYAILNRSTTSSNPGDYIAISVRRWNRFKVPYKTTPGGGTFSIKHGVNGTATNYSTDGADGLAWTYVEYASTLKYPSDTMFITNVSGSVTIYGHYAEYIETDATKPKPLEVHIAGDGGAYFSRFYLYKDPPTMHSFYDTLDARLYALISLDETQDYIINLEARYIQ